MEGSPFLIGPKWEESILHLLARYAWKTHTTTPTFFECPIAINVWKLIISIGCLNLPSNHSTSSLYTSISYGANATITEGIGAIFLSTYFSIREARWTQFLTNIKLTPLQILNSAIADISFSLMRVKGTSSGHILRASIILSTSKSDTLICLLLFCAFSFSFSLLFRGAHLLGLFGLYSVRFLFMG